MGCCESSEADARKAKGGQYRQRPREDTAGLGEDVPSRTPNASSSRTGDVSPLAHAHAVAPAPQGPPSYATSQPPAGLPPVPIVNLVPPVTAAPTPVAHAASPVLDTIKRRPRKPRSSPLGMLVISMVTTRSNVTVFRIGRVRYVGPLSSFPCPSTGGPSSCLPVVIGTATTTTPNREDKKADIGNTVAVVELMLREAPPESGRYAHGTLFDVQLVDGAVSPCFAAKPSALCVVDMGTLETLPTEVLEVIAEFGAYNLGEQIRREDSFLLFLRRYGRVQPLQRRKNLRNFRSMHPLARFLAVKGFAPTAFLLTNEVKEKKAAPLPSTPLGTEVHKDAYQLRESTPLFGKEATASDALRWHKVFNPTLLKHSGR